MKCYRCHQEITLGQFQVETCPASSKNRGDRGHLATSASIRRAMEAADNEGSYARTQP